MARLEDQIDWYDRKSTQNQRIFRRIKITEILAAALIPFVSVFRMPASSATQQQDWAC